MCWINSLFILESWSLFLHFSRPSMKSLRSLNLVTTTAYMGKAEIKKN